MRELSIDDRQISSFAERDDDGGGIVTNTLVPAGDGSYYNYRTWEGRGIKGDDSKLDTKDLEAEKIAAQEAALAKYNSLTDAEIVALADNAVENGSNST